MREMVYEVTEPIPILAAKPALELVDGFLEQKMSPTRRHQMLEERWVAALRAWAGDAGEAHSEWRHQFTAPGFRFGSLVPDVAFLSRAAVDELGPAAAEAPPRAPQIVVEVLSPGESQRTLEWKIGAYLMAGTNVVFVVDPPRREVIAHDCATVALGERVARTFGAGEIVTHTSMPGFAFAVDAMFAGLYLGD